ncbi:MAG: DNA replication complex subunit Gins51 [Candidatus Baldrarchaeia archaeon]
MDYERLYSIWLKEVENDDIQDLPSNFYEEVSKYINMLKIGMKAETLSNIETKIIELELENARFIIKDLCNLRLEKVLRNMLNGKEIPEERLNSVEKEYFKPLKKAMKDFSSFVSRILEGKVFKDLVKPKKVFEITLERGKIVVRILENLPAIVGTDMKVYGPFKKGDVAVLPRKNAETLIKKAKAKIIGI